MLSVAGVGGFSGLPDVVHEREKDGRLSLLSVAGVGRPLGLPGSVAQAFTEHVVAGRQVCGQNRFSRV